MPHTAEGARIQDLSGELGFNPVGDKRYQGKGVINDGGAIVQEIDDGLAYVTRIDGPGVAGRFSFFSLLLLVPLPSLGDAAQPFGSFRGLFDQGLRAIDHLPQH